MSWPDVETVSAILPVSCCSQSAPSLRFAREAVRQHRLIHLRSNAEMAVDSQLTSKDGGMDMEAFRKMANYALVRESTMTAEMSEETVDIVVTAVDKHQTDTEKASQVIKDAMDRKFGPMGAWHVITGQSFSYDVTHEAKCSLFMFISGVYAVLVWKKV